MWCVGLQGLNTKNAYSILFTIIVSTLVEI